MTEAAYKQTPTSRLTHYVKAREKGKRAWRFVTTDCKLTRLRVHAAMFTQEQAEVSVAVWATQDGRYEFKTAAI